jgi:hypothetical protein
MTFTCWEDSISLKEGGGVGVISFFVGEEEAQEITTMRRKRG